MSEFTQYIISMKTGHKFIIGIKDISEFNNDLVRMIEKMGDAKTCLGYLPNFGVIDIFEISAIYPKNSEVE